MADFNFSDLLDSSIDALPDGTNSLLPAGKHIITVKNVEQKKVAEKPVILFTYIYQECVELANPADKVPKTGDKFEEMFFVNSELGASQVKKHIAPQAAPGMSIADIFQGVVGEQFCITTKIKEWKDKTSGELKKGHETVGGLKSL